jgi:hypothetical protein
MWVFISEDTNGNMVFQVWSRRGFFLYRMPPNDLTFQDSAASSLLSQSSCFL